MRGIWVGLIASVLSSAVVAEERPRWHFGIGYDDLKGYRESSPLLTVDYDLGTAFSRDSLTWHLGGEAMSDGDFWIGAGLTYEYQLGNGPWFLEAEFLPGLYYREDERPGIDNLHYPMFRTKGAIGYRLKNGNEIALTLSHLSDGGFDTDAGSTESLSIRYGVSF